MGQMNHKESGFTLIELIMVIVILGILSAVIVPKFFDFTSKAETAAEDSVLGHLRSGVQLFSTNKLLTTGKKTYPQRSSQLLTRVLDEVPEGWTYDTSDGKITHTRADGSEQVWWYVVNSDSSGATIGNVSGGPPLPPPMVP